MVAAAVVAVGRVRGGLGDRIADLISDQRANLRRCWAATLWNQPTAHTLLWLAAKR